MAGKASKDARAGVRADGDAENNGKKTEKNLLKEDGRAAGMAINGSKAEKKKRRPAERSPFEKAKRQIVERMKALGTYKVQYVAAIDRTAELYLELARLAKEYEKAGFVTIVEYTNKAGATNLVKSPIRCAIEDVYHLLLAYEKELGLTPAAMKKLGASVEEKEQESPLELALKKLGGG